MSCIKARQISGENAVKIAINLPADKFGSHKFEVMFCQSNMYLHVNCVGSNYKLTLKWQVYNLKSNKLVYTNFDTA